MEDTLAFYGGAVKALGGGKVGGYLVLFSGPNAPDLQGEYFTKSTDFMIDSGDQRPILYRHGMHPLIKSQRIGKATLTIDDVGVFVDGELDLSNKYIRALYEKAEQKKDEPFLGWSSGALSHLVRKRPSPDGKSVELVAWALGEATVTPSPVEPRTLSSFSLKSLDPEGDFDLEEMVKSMNQEQHDIAFAIEGVPSIKAYCEAVSPNSSVVKSQRSDAAAHAVGEFITIAKILGEAIHSHKSLLVRRTEHRFLKDGNEIDASTLAQTETLLAGLDQITPIFESVKEPLLGIKKIGERSKAEQRAMTEKAKFALWNYYRISGFKPEELNDGNTTGEHV
jgi:hypothetical protein